MPRKPEKIVEPIDAPFEEVVRAIVTREKPNARGWSKATIEIPVTRKRKLKEVAQPHRVSLRKSLS